MLHLLWVFPFFRLFDTRSGAAICIALIISQATLNAMYGPLAARFSELFEPRVRYSGASLAYQFGAVFGGGFAPTICAALYEAFGSSLAISAYWGLVAANGRLRELGGPVRAGGRPPRNPRPRPRRAADCRARCLSHPS